MAVGATPSGVPPSVSARNDSGAAQAGVLQEILMASMCGPENQKKPFQHNTVRSRHLSEGKRYHRTDIQKAISAVKNLNWEHLHGGPSVSAPSSSKVAPFR
jgi:hypothetical protein